MNLGNDSGKEERMEGLYANIRSERRSRNDRRFWSIMTAAAGLFAVVVISVVWTMGYHSRFTKFVSGLSDSTTYAYNNDSLTAEIDGKRFKVSEENMYGIFGYLSLNKSGRESSKVPEGEPVKLDYGNGTVLELWDMPVGKRNHYLFIQYTYLNGETYSYINYKTTLETVMVRYLLYGNDEIVD